jgi:iron complex outermembrane receptor protein
MAHFRLFGSLIIAGAVTVLASVPTQPVQAQAASSEGFTLEEVVVTARRREESLQDTPIAVTAYTESEMDMRAHLTINDIAQATPNVILENSSNTSGLSGSPTLFIRGVGQSDFVINTDPAVGVYVDGVFVARSIGSMMDLMDLERAEVLRGPQGTLFGRNTLAGAINLISKRPTFDAFDAKFTAAGGENEFLQLGAAFNIPISDTLAARVSLSKRENGGFVRATSYPDLWLGDEDNTGVRAQLEFVPNDSIRTNLTIDYTKSRAAPSSLTPATLYSAVGDPSGVFDPVMMQANWWNVGTPMGGPSFSGDPDCATVNGRNTNPNCYGQVHNPGVDVYETGAIWYDINGNVDPDPTNKLDTFGAAFTFEADTDWGTFKSITAYRGFEADFRNDHDYSPILIFSNINDDFHQDGRSQEFQLVGNALDGKLDYTTGLYAFAETGTELVSLVGVNGLWVTQGRPGGLNEAAGVRFQRIVRDIDNTSKAVYGQVTYHFDAPFHLTAGVRSTSDEKTFDVTIHRDFCPATTSSQPPGGNTANGDGLIARDKVNDVCQVATGNASWDEVDPMISLAYDLNDTTMLYGTYSTGFRDGGFASRFPQGLPNPMPAFEPEYVTNFELGAKTTLFDGALQVNAALFMTNYEDMQVTATPADLVLGGTGVSNIGESDLNGLEVEAIWVVNDTLRFDATLGLLDAEITSLVSNSVTSGAYTWFGPGFLDGGGVPVSVTNCPTAVCIPLADARLPYTPETNYSIGLTHRLPLGSGGNLTTRLDYMYKDEQTFRIEPHPDMREDDYDVVNATVTYNSAAQDWALTLGIRNATDSVYSTNGSFSTGNGNSAVNLSRPRQAFLRFQYWMGGN